MRGGQRGRQREREAEDKRQRGKGQGVGSKAIVRVLCVWSIRK